MKKNLLKLLPLMAAVLLATSCSKDDENVQTQNPAPQPQTQTTIPFSIRVNTGNSLKKIDYAPDDKNAGQYNITFTEDDVDAGLKLVIKEGDNELGELTLQDKTGNFSGEIKQPASNTLTAEITVTPVDAKTFSDESFEALLENCVHTFRGEFEYNGNKDVDLTDQNAYIAISMSKCQHKLDVKSGDAEAVECELSDKGEVWVVVPSGAPLTVGSFISKTAKDVVPGKIYTVSRPHCVDLGIAGILWTDHNIGGTNPEDWGDYYAWGETEPYYKEGHAYDEQITDANYWKTDKSNGYAWATYSGFDGDDNGENFKKYKDASSATLSIEADDAAYKTDNNWSMPTTGEFQALKENCYWVWTDKYGNSNTPGFIIYKVKEGMGKNRITYGNYQSWQGDYQDLITDYSLSDPHIFLPAAGYRGDQSLDCDGCRGDYWSSSLDIGYPSNEYLLFFDSDTVLPQGDDYRYDGFPVRAVRRSL